MTSSLGRITGRFGWPWLVAAAVYVVTVAYLAALGESTESAPPLLTAVAMTLPCGAAGLVGVYGIYGALAMGARVLGAHVEAGDGTRAHWFLLLDGTTVTLMFAVVAAANAVLVHELVTRRRTR